MTPEAIFGWTNTLALLGWVLLVFLPMWRWSARLVSGVVIPLVIGIAYAFLIGTNFFGAEGGFGSIEDVRALFANDALLVAGWAHYLAFDLFVGAWEVRDARNNGISHFLVIPCLVLTFMLGPVGLLLYMAIRAAMRRKLALDDSDSKILPEGDHAYAS